jgi:hypothetical protein
MGFPLLAEGSSALQLRLVCDFSLSGIFTFLPDPPHLGFGSRTRTENAAAADQQAPVVEFGTAAIASRYRCLP